MVEKWKKLGIEPDPMCSDGPSKAAAVMKKAWNNIHQRDDWHDTTKLNAYFKETLKHIPSCDDKHTALKYVIQFLNKIIIT